MPLMIALLMKRGALARIASSFAIALCMLASTMSSGVLAQDATPGAGVPLCVNVATPVVESVIAETSETELAAATPESDAPVSADTLPAGEPVDADTAAAADAVVRMWLACYLSGEPLAVLALQSDQMDAAFAAQYGQDLERYQAMLQADLESTPVAADATIVISSGADVRVLDDGRIGGIWAIDGDEAFVMLVQEDGNWVVDEVVDLIDEGTPTP
jgi:hypothetical protein